MSDDEERHTKDGELAVEAYETIVARSAGPDESIKTNHRLHRSDFPVA